MLKKKSQGEIFGIALLFVVIIVGIAIFGKYKALNPDNSINLNTEGKYKVIAEGTLNSILKMSTGCEVERNRDRLIDLINFCIENSANSNSDPPISCKTGNKNSCSYSRELINNSLMSFLNSSLIGPIPYKLVVTLPRDQSSSLNQNYSNFAIFKYKNKFLSENKSATNPQIYYPRAGYNKATSGIRTWATLNGNIELTLNLFYKNVDIYK